MNINTRQTEDREQETPGEGKGQSLATLALAPGLWSSTISMVAGDCYVPVAVKPPPHKIVSPR